MLIRLDSGYHFRRAVPSHIRDIIGKREIWHSLGTTKRHKAKSYACEIYAITERLFSSATRIMEELTESETFIMDELPDDVRELFASLIKTYRHEIQTLKTKNKQQQLKHNLDAIELIQETEKAKDIAEQGVHLLQETIENIKQLKTPTATALVDIQSQINEMKAFLKPQETKPSPLFSEAVPSFLATKVKAKSTVIKSYQMTFRRFLEVCGDKPIRDYTGEDAGAFKSLMEQLPETYGKQRNDNRTIQEFVEYANLKKLPRVSGKAVKNHFTRLSAFFKHFLLRDMVDRNVFTGGWQFDNKPKTKRVRWSDTELKTITGQPWQFGTISHKTASMIVAIASYTGMRLEEICRLRPQDIQEIKGAYCIIVQDHESIKNQPWTAWSAKTEAGSRVIPICSALRTAGILDLATRARNQGRHYLFHDLQFTGQDKKRSAHFQRDFSKFKTRLGIGKSVVFHSFRHNVSTKLRNIHEHGEGGLRESWIDSFLGHEGNNKSVGNTVYFDDVDIENLTKVAESVTYPVFWNIEKLFKPKT
ncbi:MAG: tyrosine-type recombinase/integrase [Komagataeibacter hansenii]|nr:tyrosine-type recombinase/integrase [Novacetimonas hansenii]